MRQTERLVGAVTAGLIFMAAWLVTDVIEELLQRREPEPPLLEG